MNLIAYFTDAGVPKTGLSPTIDVWEMDGTHAVNAQNMTEVAGGFYYYNFAAYDTAKDYAIRADGGAGLSVFERYVEASNEVPINVDNAEAAIKGTPGKTNQEVYDHERGTDGAYTGTPPTVGEIRTEMESAGTKLTTVKTQTDKMNFTGANIDSQVEAIAASAVDSIHDEVIEGALTSRQIQMLLLAFVAGETTGGGTTTVKFKNQAGDKFRITMTVDANGNRSLVVTDVT